MLKKARLAAAIIFWGIITLLFLDFTGTLHAWFGWMARIQFLPAVLALNLGVVILLVALTLVFGRVYCSVICPLGVFQDVVSWINGRRGKKSRMRFAWSPAKDWLRYGMLAVFIAALAAGAIMMVPSDASDPGSPEIPVINTEKCIGCGACEYLCPARPFSAIYVEGHQMHSEF